MMDRGIISFILILVALSSLAVLYGVCLKLGTVEEPGTQRIPIIRTFVQFHHHMRSKHTSWVFWTFLITWTICAMTGIALSFVK